MTVDYGSLAQTTHASLLLRRTRIFI